MNAEKIKDEMPQNVYWSAVVPFPLNENLC